MRLLFLITILKDIDICACGIGNEYLNAPCQGKLWTKSGSEFSSDKGYVLLIVRILYELKSSGAACI